MRITRRDFIKKSAGIAGIAALGDMFFNMSKVVAQDTSSDVPFAPEEDVLIPSTDIMCVNFCGIRVRRVNGVIRQIYGNPDSPYNKGHLCPKGQSGVFQVYNPYRIKKPLKRTNSNKGTDVDPGWKEITWEEAFSEIASKLSDVKANNPNGFTFIWGHGKYLMQDKFLKAFLGAIGSPNNVHRTTVCEAAKHVADELTWGGHGPLPDLEYTKYYLNMGSNFTEGEQWARWMDRTVMPRIVNGEMKMVVVEPRLSNAGAKANKWVPIRPGKDVVFLLAMAKELINNGYVDEEFLINYTDACYLVDTNTGKFYRDGSGNPLVWDGTQAVPYDSDTSIVLDTEQVIGSTTYKTAFRVFKDYVNSLTESEVEEITGVPYSTIKEIAKEFGENAHIGETIEIDGQQVRYRPAVVYSFRGLAAKEYGSQNWRAGLIVNMLVGNLDAVGGLVLHHADPNGKNMSPSTCEYPPQRVDLAGSVFYPHATHNVAQQPFLTFADPSKYGYPYTPEVCFIYASNRPFSTSDTNKQFEGLKNVYTVNINIVLDEAAQMADIVLPDKTYLETYHYSPTRWTPDSSHKAIRQPIVNAYNLEYDAFEILMEIADRAGFLDEYINQINSKWGLPKNNKQFQPGKKYTSEEAVQIIWEAETGESFDTAKQNGLIASTTDVQKRYFENAEKFKGSGPKMHFYAEQLITTKETLTSVMNNYADVKQVFHEWYETADDTELNELLDIKFSPLPKKEHADPTPHRNRDKTQYPYYLITYKRMYRNQANPEAMNPILNEVAHDSDTNFVLINKSTAAQLGIEEGDEIYVESVLGKVKGTAKLTNGIRPDTVAISYHYGRFALGFPDYAKKGTHPNEIMEYHPDIISGHNSFNDTMVKIYKA